MSEPTRLLLVEDQTLILGALSALLGMESDMQIVAAVESAELALAVLEEQAVDVVLTDIEMPGMGGLELAERLRKSHPDLCVGIVTTFARKGYLRRALDAGVRGYLLKDTSADQLADSIRRMRAGERVIDPELAATARAVKNPLTPREREVLRLAAEGMTTQMIGSRIHLSEGTVRNYLSEAISKLHARNRVEAARIARDEGFL